MTKTEERGSVLSWHNVADGEQGGVIHSPTGSMLQKDIEGKG